MCVCGGGHVCENGRAGEVTVEVSVDFRPFRERHEDTGDTWDAKSS